MQNPLNESPNKLNSKSSHGFTIIELLIATTVFSVVLLVFLSAFLRISELFYKGVNMSNTQEDARIVMQDITDDIQFSQQTPFVTANYFCIGIHRYTVNYGQQVTASVHGIYREDIQAGCPPPSTPGINGVELLDTGMQVNKLSVSSPCVNQRCTISMHIIFYGNDSTVLYSPSGASPAASATDAECTGPANSTQYCASADYNATVLQSF